jgi:hypothetical protein
MPNKGLSVEEFKKIKPEYKDIEGDQLWNAMEDYMLRQQQGQEVVKHLMPFFKRYQLRWLFYRKMQNLRFVQSDYTSTTRCSNCKKPAGGMQMGWQDETGFHIYCNYCRKVLKEEPNRNVDHLFWMAWRYIPVCFWWSLDKLHIVRSSINERYGMFGDESKYIHHWTMDYGTGKTTQTLKPRKWWEYIFIERKQFKF